MKTSFGTLALALAAAAIAVGLLSVSAISVGAEPRGAAARPLPATPPRPDSLDAGTAERQRRAPPGRAAALLSPFGPRTAPAAELLPADAGVCTRAGLYATRSQAAALELAVDGGVAWADVGCCGDAAVDVAQGIVHGLMAAHDLGADAPVFIGGTELRRAAQLVDRLGAQGLTQVFLITR
jgi:hypothetical protein